MPRLRGQPALRCRRRAAQADLWRVRTRPLRALRCGRGREGARCRPLRLTRRHGTAGLARGQRRASALSKAATAAVGPAFSRRAAALPRRCQHPTIVTPRELLLLARRLEAQRVTAKRSASQHQLPYMYVRRPPYPQGASLARASAPSAVRCSTGCRWSHCSCAARSAPACSAPARGAVCRSAICCWPCSGCLACSALACSAPASSVAFRCMSCSCCCCTVLLPHKRPGVAVHCLHRFASRAGGGRHGGQLHCRVSLPHCQDGADSGLLCENIMLCSWSSESSLASSPKRKATSPGSAG